MRNFVLFLALSLGNATLANAEVLKANLDPDVTSDDVVICVAANVHLIHPGLSLTTQTFDGPVKDLCKAFAGHTSIEEVHLLTGGDATADNVRVLLQSLARRGTYGTIRYVYRGLGFGADQDGSPRLMLADWNAAAPDSGLDIVTLDAQLEAVADRRFVFLDAVTPATDDVLGGMATMGPSAVDWPSSTAYVISPSGRRQQTGCGDRMLRAIAAQIRAVSPDKGLKVMTMQDSLLDGAKAVREGNCPTYMPTVYGGGAWVADADLLTETVAMAPPLAVMTIPVVPDPPLVIPTATVTLPTEPLILDQPNKKISKIGLDTWLLAGATAVLGATCGVTEPWLLNNLAATQTQADVQRNFSSQEEVDAHRAITPALGYTATTTCAATGVALSATILTGVF